MTDEQHETITAHVRPADLSGPIEALLLMAEEPMAAATLAEALDVPMAPVEQCLADLARFYDETGRGFELRHIAGGWRYATRAEHAEVIGAWVVSGQHGRLSQAALETLSVIAYTQPISRSRVSAVRGVNVDGVVRTLLARNLIAEAGQGETSGAMLFCTTDYFLERMGIASIDELPPIAPHLPDAETLAAELSQVATEAAVADAATATDSAAGGEQAQPDSPEAD